MFMLGHVDYRLNLQKNYLTKKLTQFTVACYGDWRRPLLRILYSS